MKTGCIFFLVLITTVSILFSQTEPLAGDEALGSRKYNDFERPQACRSCHTDFYQQWSRSMMSQAYTHHWDEIEYFELAIPHAEKESKVADVKAGCNGCHAPISFLAGDVPPPRPEEKSRANEAISCDFCHTISGFKGDIPHNYNYISSPGRVKYGPRAGLVSPEHETRKLDFIRTAEFCGTCHNEKSPFGVWVKSTHLEWKEGPYAEQGVPCQQCHEPPAPGRNAKQGDVLPDAAQHLFHGAHDPGKVKGAIEMRIYPEIDEAEPGDRVKITLALFNGKCGHKVPSGSVEDRQLWVHVKAVDADGNVYHLPVDKKGFDGEEYTISSNEPAYQDIGEMVDDPDYQGLPRDALEFEGDRVFRMAYFDPKGRVTMAQWNTASLGVDYRIGPRETKLETYTWTVPDDIPLGIVTVHVELNYRKLVKSVADYLNVPEDESEIMHVNSAETTFEVFD